MDINTRAPVHGVAGNGIFSNKMKLYQSLNNYWITMVMIKGHLSTLISKGKVAYKLENYCMYWYRV